MKYRTFQPQFHDAIRQGIKISTIRGKPWCRVGDRIALRYWTGMAYRSKMGTIGTAVVCLIVPVAVCEEGPLIDPLGSGIATDEHLMAAQEGFSGWPAMRDWFQRTHGLPYTGILTRWNTSTLELAQSPREGVAL